MSNSSMRARLGALCLLTFGVSPSAAGSQGGPGATAAPIVDGVTINGPAPPAPPAVLARDAEGRVTIRAVRLADGLQLDGRLDEEVYRTVPSIGDFIQVEPDAGAPATEATEVWIFFDDDAIYVSAKCWDSQPEERWVANELRRDNQNVVRNDNFAFFLDTFYDRRNAFIFEITPIGGFWESYVTNERSPGNVDWNPIWDRKVGRFEGGWTVEAAIPFKSLRYRPGAAQVWGISLRRRVTWKNEESFVMRVPPNAGSVIFQVSLGGTLLGLSAPAGSKNLEIKPYAISSLTTDRLATPALSNDPDGDLGFDVKYGLTQNLTADFTYNTDFAQVEVDEQQVNLTRFSLFFPEKREFFLEGLGIFDFGGATSVVSPFGGGGGPGITPLLFFSRRIGLHQGRAVPIEVGGRLTGKVGKFSVGVLNVYADDLPVAGTPATNFSVVRVKRDIFRRSSIGALSTRRSASLLGNGSSETYGVDAAFGFFDNLSINTYLATTKTPGLTGDDTSYRAQLNYNADRYGLQLERLMVGDNFNPEVGFMSRDNFRRSFALFRFSPRPRSIPLVRKLSWDGSFDYLTDGEGTLESRNASASFGIEFQNGDGFSTDYGHNYEALDLPFQIARGVTVPIGGYDFQDIRVAMTLGNQRRVSGTLSLTHGGFFGGDRTAIGYSGGRVELTPRFSLEPAVSTNWVDLPYGQFRTTLISNRGTFTVTPQMFFSGLLQYNSTNESVSTNLRFRWEYHPGSDMFVVYTDERDTSLRGFPGMKNRAFVVKINRLVRF